MPSVTSTRTLPAPPERVWALISDVNRYDRWLTMHHSWPKGPPAGLAVGVMFRQWMDVLSQPTRVDWTVAVHRGPSELDMRGAAALGIRLALRFTLAGEPSGRDTAMAMAVALDGGPLTGPLGAATRRVATRVVGKQLEASLDELAALLD